MGELTLHLWTNASPFRADRSAIKYELAFLKDGNVVGTREERFAADANQQGAILEGLISALSRINDDSGMPLRVITHNDGIICRINQKQYEIWSQNGWINSKGKEVKHAGEWQRIRELIHKKVSDITARPPGKEDEAIMQRLGAEEINPRVSFFA